jgi:polysaccharide export outer membrane protein
MKVMPKISLLRAIAGLLVVTLLLSGPGVTPRGQSPAETGADSLYRIKPGDLLEVFVWREPDLTRTVTVRADGRISLPLVQDLKAATLTPSELCDHITELLKQFVSNPAVSVIVQPTENFVVYVLGNVERPGMYQFREPVTVLQALAMGGRFGDFADQENIRIIRGTGENANHFPFNYKEVLKGKNLEQNMLLQNNDVVLIP